MAAKVPRRIADLARDIELGELIGRFQQTANTAVRITMWMWAALFGFSFLATLQGASSTRTLSSVAPVESVLLVLTVLLPVWAWRIKHSRVMYLYQEGIIATSTFGRVQIMARWEEVELRWRVFLAGEGVGQGARDEFRLSVPGAATFKFGLRRDREPGPTILRLSGASRLSVLRDRVLTGQPVPFGPYNVTPAGLVRDGRTLPWGVALLNPGRRVIVVATAAGREASFGIDTVPDYVAVLLLAAELERAYSLFQGGSD